MRSGPGRVAAMLLVGVICAGIVATVNATTSASTRVSRRNLHVDFGTRTTVAPRGYLLDYGLPFSAARGYGWEKASTGKALSVVRNGVRRTTGHPPDRRYATLVQMQATRGVTAPARWQAALVNGVYDVTVAVGDPAATDSVNRLTAQPGSRQQVVLVGGFRPTAAHHFFTVSKRVRVSNGRLTLTPSGGRNTKIDFVVATPVPVHTTPSPGGPTTSPPSSPAPTTAPTTTAPTTAPTTTPAGSGGVVDLTTGGTVSPTCQVSGFDGVLPNSAGNQCDPSRIAFGAHGLTLTSTPGQLAEDNQQNALYKDIDATGDFTVTARVVGPVNQLTADYQQAGLFFGPNQKNFVKVEAEHSEPGAPHLTMFYRENGVAGTVGSIALPALTSASTVDLTLRDRSHQLTAYYSLNGAPMLQVGTAKTPADTAAWFSATGHTGILDSNTGSTTAITVTFSRLTISSP